MKPTTPVLVPLVLPLVLPLALASATLAACDTDPATIEVAISLGHETGAMQVEPVVAKVTVEAKNADGKVIGSGSAKPGGAVDLGDFSAEDFVAFEVRGADAAGNAVLRGRSLGFLAGALDGEVLPLFAQRLGGFARPPGGIPLGHVGGVATIIAERWLISTGGARALAADGSEGDVASADFYDLFAWDGAAADELPRAAASIVGRSTSVLLIDGGGATWFDFDSGESAEADAPGGIDFASVAGGRTIEAPDGVSFVVGATRPAGDATATTTVLRVAEDGTLTAAALATPRLGAAATWVEGVGLVVAGGSAEGAGIEVLGSDDELAHALPFPASTVTGAALVSIGESTALRVGGIDVTADPEAVAPAPTSVVSLTCAVDCALDIFPDDATLPSIRGTVAYSTARGVLAVGADVDGATRPFLVPLDRTAAVEAPLREPRSGAAVTPAPNGTLAVIGGILPDGKGATHVEMFFPE